MRVLMFSVIMCFVFISGCVATSNRTNTSNEQLRQEIVKDFMAANPNSNYRQSPSRRPPLSKPHQQQPAQQKPREHVFSTSHFIGSIEFSKYKRLAVLPFTDAPDVEQSGIIVQGVAVQKFSQFGFDVVERSRLDDIISEQQFSNTGYADQSSSVEIGKLLGVQAIVVGEVSLFSSTRQVVDGVARMESFVSLTMRVVDVETGSVVFSGSGNTKRGVYKTTDEIANALINKLLFLWLTSPGLIGLQYDKDKFVIRAMPNSSAAQAGIVAGDKIVMFNGYDLSENDRLKEREVVYGKPGTTMDITIERNGELFSYTLTRHAKEDFFK